MCRTRTPARSPRPRLRAGPRDPRPGGPAEGRATGTWKRPRVRKEPGAFELRRWGLVLGSGGERVVVGADDLVVVRTDEDGRYRADGTGTLRLRGRRGGSVVTFTAEASFPERTDANGFIPRLWASRKLGHLTRQVWLEGPTASLVEEIKQTALRYGLPSEYTASNCPCTSR